MRTRYENDFAILAGYALAALHSYAHFIRFGTSLAACPYTPMGKPPAREGGFLSQDVFA